MKKGLLFLFPILLSSFNAFAQYSQVVDGRLNQIANLKSASNAVNGFDHRKGKLIGHRYLFDQWMYGTITLKNREKVDSLRINFDIQNEFVEIKISRDIKAASTLDLNGFSVTDSLSRTRHFVSMADFDFAEGKMEGFAEVLFDDEIWFIKKYSVTYIEPNYVRGMDMGSLNAEIKKKHKYYIIIDNEITEFNKRKSFGDKKKEVKSFIRTNQLSLRKERHLKLAVEYYNSLL